MVTHQIANCTSRSCCAVWTRINLPTSCLCAIPRLNHHRRPGLHQKPQGRAPVWQVPHSQRPQVELRDLRRPVPLPGDIDARFPLLHPHPPLAPCPPQQTQLPCSSSRWVHRLHQFRHPKKIRMDPRLVGHHETCQIQQDTGSVRRTESKNLPKGFATLGLRAWLTSSARSGEERGRMAGWGQEGQKSW